MMSIRTLVHWLQNSWNFILVCGLKYHTVDNLSEVCYFVFHPICLLQERQLVLLDTKA